MRTKEPDEIKHLELSFCDFLKEIRPLQREIDLLHSMRLDILEHFILPEKYVVVSQGRHL